MAAPVHDKRNRAALVDSHIIGIQEMGHSRGSRLWLSVAELHDGVLYGGVVVAVFGGSSQWKRHGDRP
jgi:hypothetical protein